MYSWQTNRRRIAALAGTALALLLVLLLVAAPTEVVQADPNSNVGVFPPSSLVYGKTYGEWSVAWWQWAFSSPFSQSALNDATGARCGVGQGGRVWFLGGVFNSSGTVVRDCTVPSWAALFIPILNGEWDQVGYDTPQTEQQLRATVGTLIDHSTGMYMTVDGRPLVDLAAYRTRSAPFTYTMSATDNLYGLNCSATFPPVCVDGSGQTVPFPGLICTGGPNSRCTAAPVAPGYPGAVGDGYYVMLAPLSPGSHTLHFGGTFLDDQGNPLWVLDITYHLWVSR